MPISEVFLQKFEQFVTNYKTNSTPAIYHWTKDYGYQEVGKLLAEILDIIQNYTVEFHDASIIDNLNNTVVLRSKQNPYLLQCWRTFLTDYNAATKRNEPTSSIHIKVRPSENLADNMLTDLQETLSMAIREKNYYKKELERKEKEILALKERLWNQEKMESIQIHASKTQEQLHILLRLMQTEQNPIPMEVASQEPPPVAPPPPSMEAGPRILSTKPINTKNVSLNNAKNQSTDPQFALLGSSNFLSEIAEKRRQIYDTKNSKHFPPKEMNTKQSASDIGQILKKKFEQINNAQDAENENELKLEKNSYSH